MRKIAAVCLALVLVFSVNGSVFASGGDPFMDVDAGDYFYDSVLWAYTYGITAGKTADSFQPGASCTREQIVTFLWRMAGKPEPTAQEILFSDVPRDQFTNAILWATEKEIVQGYADGTFRPDEACSRKHAMTFLWRYFGKPEAANGEIPFPDVAADRFADAIMWAVENGITQGYKDGSFRPEKLCTRAEIVTFLYRSQHPQVVDLPDQWTVCHHSNVKLWKDIYESGYRCTIRSGETVTLLDWNFCYAHVQYKSYTGYVYAPYLQNAGSADLSQWISVVEPVEVYSYEQMMEDLHTLRESRPWLVTLDSIGTSELGRDIPVLRIGREDAKYHVLLQGAIHGREHMTAWLLTAMAEFWITHGIEEHGDICYHIIPMANPDGVYISQTADLTEDQKQIYYSDYYSGKTEENYVMYSRRWKANGLGVDLNRNFDAGWSRVRGRSEPSSELYKGSTAFCAAESIALRDYTLTYDFDVTVSYHSSGSIIYYEYGDNDAVNARSSELARAVEAVTGYPLRGSGAVDAAGYKDWVIDALGIPSLTVEIGVGESPLQLREIYGIFARNLYVMSAIAQWLREGV